MGVFKSSISRRRLLKSAAAVSVAAPAIWTFDRAFAADQLTIADTGGGTTVACRKAFYDPFEKETGIRIVSVAQEADPVTQVKLMVDSGNVLWDACFLTPDFTGRLTKDKEYLEKLNITPEEAEVLLPGMVTDYDMTFHIFAVMMAYRTDKFGENGPANWADFFDVEKFPGKRGLYRGVQGMLEMVLLGDGVPRADLYPLDVERGLRKLETIRDHIVWWNSGAQLTQLLQSGEVDMSDAWHTRVAAVVDSGAPVKAVWDGIWASDGWGILKGSPNADLTRQFVRFCMKAAPQAEYATLLKVGPSNKEALAMLDPAVLAQLPTAPDNMKNLRVQDSITGSRTTGRSSNASKSGFWAETNECRPAHCRPAFPLCIFPQGRT